MRSAELTSLGSSRIEESFDCSRRLVTRARGRDKELGRGLAVDGGDGNGSGPVFEGVLSGSGRYIA